MNDPQVDEAAFVGFERERHDWLAKGYSDFFTPITAHALAPLLAAVSAGAGVHLLDVACGPGPIARAAAAVGATACGVDLSGEMLAIARALGGQVDYREADAGSLPFPAGSFDAVVCGFGLGHFPNPPRVLAECVRVLRPGARAAVSWWDGPEHSRIQGIYVDALREAGAVTPPELPAGPPMFRYSEESALHGLLSDSGLQGIEITRHPFLYPVASVDALWEGCMSSMARTSALVLAQPPEIFTRVREAFTRLASRYEDGGALRIPIAFRVASGQRPSRGPA